MKWGATQRYQVLSTQGDEQLCLKAWSTPANAGAMPPPPPEMASGLLLDFRP
ncbi:putative lipoprotein [Erwinia sp. Ejp617]|nr:putative lipoprotein [Erwinia sp. Ejp617]